MTCPICLACGTGKSYLSMYILPERTKYTPKYVRAVTFHENVNFKHELLFMKEPEHQEPTKDLHFRNQNLKFHSWNRDLFSNFVLNLPVIRVLLYEHKGRPACMQPEVAQLGIWFA